MENKENVFRRTKIPLPIAPLPALPRHLLKEKKENDTKRHPLQTLHSQSVNVGKAGPSNNRKLVPNKQKKTNINPGHVTSKTNCDNSNWDYKVFNDHGKKADSVIPRADDEECSKQQNEKKVLCFAETANKNSLVEQRAAVTPVIKSGQLEHSRIRNIKRSLRRPHRRELQGLSPVAKLEKKVEDTAKRRLIFIKDNLLEKLQGSGAMFDSYVTCLNRDYSMDMFNYLLSIEKKPIDMPEIPWITRACVINWLIKINGPEGNPAVVQSACWYLDSLLGTCIIEMNQLPPIAAACYWIAQKLQGSVYRGMLLVTLADNVFTLKELKRAERAVMKRLQFPNNPVVPQDFITYFSWWCNNNSPGDIEVASTFLCMSGLLAEKALCDEFPSTIAAASVKNALYLMGKKGLLDNLRTCPVYIAAEKKALNMAFTSATLRRAVRTISAPKYEYKTLLEHYGYPPKYIAQKIVYAANEFCVSDTRNINK